ncbi:plasmid partition protein ParG [Desulfonatronum parangueonense]
MSGKKINIGPRPSTQPKAQTDEWVESRNQVKKMKRLTVDIPESLHRAMKSDCAMRGVKIADMIRELLTEKFDR